jgi:hypothetical protein
VIERFKNGLRIVRASWDVLRADREMLVLPILSLLATLGIAALVFIGLFWDDIQLVRAGGDLLAPSVGDYIVLAVASYVLTFVAIFFQVAQVCAADERMSGGDPTLVSAIRGAASHASAIAPWALLAMVVSMILRAIEERGGWIGKIAAGALGLAWALITYLVLPILVIEGVGVREALRRSKDLFTTTWGETVSGEIGMSVVSFFLILAGLPVALLIGGGGQPELVIAATVLFVGWVLVVATVMGALNTVFRVALYRFAADGAAPEAFGEVDFASVFPPKRSRGLLRRSA